MNHGDIRLLEKSLFYMLWGNEFQNKVLIDKEYDLSIEKDAHDLALKVAKTILKESGAQGLISIGEGNYGEAFKTAQNDVLKITTNPKEADNSNKIKNKIIKGVVFIQDVKNIKNTPIYYIMQEYGGVPISRAPGYKSLATFIDYEWDNDPSSLSKYSSEFPGLQSLIDALNELEKHGVSHGDVHSNNIVVDNDGNLRHIDLGVSGVTDSNIESISLLEYKLLNIFNNINKV